MCYCRGLAVVLLIIITDVGYQRRGLPVVLLIIITDVGYQQTTTTICIGCTFSGKYITLLNFDLLRWLEIDKIALLVASTFEYTLHKKGKQFYTPLNGPPLPILVGENGVLNNKFGSSCQKNEFKNQSFKTSHDLLF
jgi:hypothetical protein